VTLDGAFADLSEWRKAGIFGPDALAWLDGLVTARVADLGPGRARRALLLSPEGGIQAEFQATIAGANVLLLQDPAQPLAATDLLYSRIGSWDVVVEDRGAALSLFAFPGAGGHPEAPGVAYCSPSCLGPGTDLVALMGDRDRLVNSLSRGWRLADNADLETWRIENARPRLGDDVFIDEVPIGLGFDDAIDMDKPSFLGKDSLIRAAETADGFNSVEVARVAGRGPLARGERLLRDGEEFGRVTSVARAGDETLALARLRPGGRPGPLVSDSGTPVETRED
jgi:glycine cleavage system aminomethyltransferase T